MLNKNTPGVKKCDANQTQHYQQVHTVGAIKNLISDEAKKLLINIIFNSLNDIYIVYSIFSQVQYDWLCHLAIFFVIKVAK